MSRGFNEPQMQSNFGEQIVTELDPVIQLANQYELITDLEETFTATGGTVTSADNLWNCNTTTSVGSFAVIRSRSPVRYRAGLGIMGRITGKFTTGVALSVQFAGFFSVTETMAFGYDGADFSVLHDYKGQVEIQHLVFTVGAAGAEATTVTVDGTAVTCNLTNSSIEENAFECVRDLTADATASAKFNFYQNDGQVICIGNSSADYTGTFSFSNGGGASAASFSKKRDGAAKTENRIAQASWNGVDVSGWFDPTKINVFMLQYGYLGASDLMFSIKNPVTGKFELVHRIEWPNNNTGTNFGNPSMKIGWTAASLGSTTALTTSGGSCAAFVEGKEVVTESSKALDASKASIGTTLTNILTLRGRPTYGDKISFGEFQLLQISAENDHNKGLIIEVIKNATVAGIPDYNYVDETNSIVDYDSAGTTVTGGTIVAEFLVGAATERPIDLSNFKQFILPNETLTIAAKTVSGTATTSTVAVVWVEEK
jgi:hypothetical protein